MKQTTPQDLVGRPMPAQASHKAKYLASFIAEDGKFTTRLTPSEAFFEAPHEEARKEGLIHKADGVKMGKNFTTRWALTEEGQIAARAAQEEIETANIEIRKWADDLVAAKKKQALQ